MSVRRTAAILLALMVLAAPTPAWAHGIGEAGDRSVLEFVLTGIEHMLLGWDHLLFVLGVLLIAAQARLAAGLITLFVLGHSTTLIAATLAGWRVDPDTVDVVIALSVAFVAGVGIVGRPKDFRWFGAVVLVFGLIHGLGLATRFQDLGIPSGSGRLWRVIAFNVGIEIGQLIAIAVMAGLLLVASRFIPVVRRPRARQLACVPMLFAGSIAASLIAQQGFDRAHEHGGVVELAADSSCEISDANYRAPVGGGHPAQDFYAADETTPMEDFMHVVGDGFVAVLYAEDTAAEDVEWLGEYVAGDDGRGIVAGPTDALGVTVFNSREAMVCRAFERESIEEFSQAWLEGARG